MVLGGLILRVRSNTQRTNRGCNFEHQRFCWV